MKLIRPYTLTASLSPVLLAVIYAIKEGYFRPTESLLCLAVAVLAQIASNIANEYFDYVNESDSKESLGPNHPLSQGWLNKTQVLWALGLSVLLTIAAGIVLVFMHGAMYILVGLSVCLGLFAYSAGPWPLSKHGLGDIAVFIFYGLIPTYFTYHLQSGKSDPGIWLLSGAMGFMSTCILVVNNYRDYEEDKVKGKRTSIVLMGKKSGPKLYLFCFVSAIGLLFPFYSLPGLVVLFPYVLFFAKNYRALLRLSGRKLNIVLAHTAIMVFLFVPVCTLLLFLS
ncbi:hypothetical protein HQ45_03885 [Porphyromonas crevioricanis]|uniref:1,4-dihydroxy-2-naphthoate octaprenyltransferase n=1 Tax=Porphyromonas crevioricanis TaxID=393921 RepID=A0AB34PFV2_9PORP|nr:hypothetical protein HQ45_03885 [Porphyromonas crevioricanis]KGN94155.1 hypothetical protein HQ38_06370 [Porphyromonas crevioricanis]